MDAKLVFGAVVLLLIVYTTNKTAESTSLSPPASMTGAPGEVNCGQACHGSSTNIGPGQINFSFNYPHYIPDSSYNLSVELIDDTKSKFGFQITALDNDDKMAGFFTSNNNTSIQTGLNRKYIGHKSADSTNLWQFVWDAPSSNVGPITFYIAANAANGNSATTGDNIYTTSDTINPEYALSTIDLVSPNIGIDVFPNPTSGQFSIELRNRQSGQIKILNSIGKFAYKSDIEGTTQIKLPSYLKSGIYFICIEIDNQVSINKLILHRE